MPLPAALAHLALPVIASPMFIVSQPALVRAQCLAGIVGSFPALNARPQALLDEWLAQLTEDLAAARAADPSRIVAPFAVNQIVHASNDRLDADMALCVKYRVPLIITSLRAPGDVVREVHAYGGLVFHDVISVKHAKKAIDEGVDGLIVVAAGAGGHAGTLSPFALVSEVRAIWDGPIVLAGAISRGEHILAAQAMGADLAYIGTRFIATEEAHAAPDYKQALVDAQANDIVYSSYFTGVHGNYLRASIERQGLDPDNLPSRDKSTMQLGASDAPVKAWRDIWGAGQGVGAIGAVEPAAVVVARLQAEYATAKARLAAN